MTKQLIQLLSSVLLVACGGGGSNSSPAAPTPFPNPNPISGSYNGIPYPQLGDPPGFSNYPQAYFPIYTASTAAGLKIAYGRSSDAQVANLTAYVSMAGYICSATPVLYNPTLHSTFLIGAAHCFVRSKAQSGVLGASDLFPLSSLSVSYGLSLNSGWWASYPVQAVYLMQNYCQGSTFHGVSNCPNFDPNSVAGGQGNDLAIIQIRGVYANPESYPRVESAVKYPQPATMAPILSIGYGLNTQTPINNDVGLARNTMFYVENYFYQYSSYAANSGFYYLYNSFYNQGAFNQSGYTALICGGDSGGGDLFWTGKYWILLAEHTYGPAGQCGTFYPYLPNAATNVSSYYSWIESIIQDKSAAGPIHDCSFGIIPNCVTNA